MSTKSALGVKSIVIVFVLFLAPNITAITLEEVDARIAQLSMETADDGMQELRQLYEKIRETLLGTEQHNVAAKKFKAVIRQGPDKLVALYDALKPVETGADQDVGNAGGAPLTIEEIEATLLQEQSHLQLLHDQAQNIVDERRISEDEPDFIRARRKTIQRRVAEIETYFATEEDLPTNPVATAAKILKGAELTSFRAELRRLEQQQLSHSIRLELTRAEQQLALQKHSRQSERTAQFEALLLSQQRNVANALIEQAQRSQDGATGRDELVQTLVRQNERYGRELARILEQQSATAKLKTELETSRLELQKAFDRAQERLRYAGSTSVLGHLLIEQRRDVPDIRRLVVESNRRQEAVSRTGLRSLEIDDRLKKLSAPDSFIAALLEAHDLDQHADSEIDRVRRDLEAAVQTQQTTLELLASNASNYLRTLADTEYEAQQLVELSTLYRQYLDQQITWIPNAPIVSGKTFIDAFQGAQWLFSISNWKSTASSAKDGLVRVPFVTGLGVITLVLLLLARRVLNQILIDIGVRVGNIRVDHFRYTIIALIASLLLSMPMAISLWLLFAVLRASPDPQEFSVALSLACQTIAPIVFGFEWLRRLLRKNGVARQHLRWSENVSAYALTLTNRLAVVFIPAYFIAMLFENQSNAVFQYGLGRVAFISAMIPVALYAYRMTRRESPLLKYLVTRFSNALITRCSPLLSTLLILGPIAHCALASIGYYYTALNLTHYLLLSALLVLVTIVFRSTALRWLILAQMRLTLKRAKERRDAARAAQAAHLESDELNDDDLPIDIATINTQTRMLLSNIVGWSFALSLYFIWQGALPALGFLESVELWEIEASTATGTVIEPITMATVLVAAIIMTITFIAAKNLPGVLEIGLLQRLPLQAGSRYAITTLSQYAIAAIGIMFVLGALGARWSQIQWLVAALSVGLGFGLQEIVANFISGLILLFERPIRVGDTVTIGELTGKVTRIRIRATTIVDWDNKEIVVPNKNFITDRFVNWTLSDPVIRVTVNVGIAYGSDVAQALKIMDVVSQEQEMVLADPAPRALFLGFGDSSLDFQIQVYIRDQVDRLTVTHEIHMAVNKQFIDADIEIPFPQRDIHVKSSAHSTVITNREDPLA